MTQMQPQELQQLALMLMKTPAQLIFRWYITVQPFKTVLQLITLSQMVVQSQDRTTVEP